MSAPKRRALWIACVALVALLAFGLWLLASRAGRATDTPTGPSAPSSSDLGLSPPVRTHGLSGTVIDDYGRAVPGAVVEALQLHEGQWSAVSTSATDDAGGFVIRELTEGEYEVRARKDGFSDEALSGVAVPPRPEAPPIRLTLERAGVLRGRVVEDSGRPAKGATVMLRDTGATTAPTAIAAEDGTFAIQGLAAGVYGVQARLGVFVSEVEEGLEVQPGAEAYVDLELAASAVLIGSVVDRETQQPVARARLVFDPGVLGPAGETLDVSPQGTFSVAGLREGPVRVVVEAPGYVPASGLGNAGSADAFVIPLDRSATLSGVVVDEAGEPVRGAELEILAEGMELADGPAAGLVAASDNLGVTVGPVPKIPLGGSAAPLVLVGGAIGSGPAIWQTGADGSFEIAPVGPGRVRVAAHHAALAAGETAPIEVTAGVSVTGLRITLESGGTLIGEVRDQNERGVSGIAIELSLGSGERRTTATDSSGHFELGPVRGAGVVTAHPPGEPAVQAEVEIGPDEEVPVVLRLTGATGSLTGEVRGSAGQPLVAAVVRVLVPDATPPLTRTAVTDSQGEFAIEGLPLERCRLEIEHPDHAPFAIEVVPGGPPVQAELAEGARVTAEVRDAITGKPLAGALLTLRGTLGNAPLRGRTDRQGKIEIRSVTIDEYDVFVEHAGYASERFRSAIEGADERSELGIIELSSTGSAVGQVIDRYGSTVAGVEVTAGDPPRWQDAVRSGRDGRFRLGSLPAGEVVLTARGRGGSRSDPVEARIDSGEETAGLVLRLPDAQDEPEGTAEPSPPAAAPERVAERAEATEPDDTLAARPRTTPAVAIALGYAQGEVRVTEVLSASARAAGLEVGDVVSAIDGEKVLAASQGRSLLRGTAGSVVSLELRRDGKRVRVRVPREASPGW